LKAKFKAAAAAAASTGTDWLIGGGEMAKVIKSMDWSKTPLGPIDSWPPSLRTVVSLAQASNSPISLAWGSGHVQIYNDGYWPICGAKHPRAMGQDFRECWASAFPVIGEAYATAWSGKSAYLEKMRMFLWNYKKLIGACRWQAASLMTANAYEKSTWLAGRLRQWTRAYILDLVRIGTPLTTESLCIALTCHSLSLL